MCTRGILYVIFPDVPKLGACLSCRDRREESNMSVRMNRRTIAAGVGGIALFSALGIGQALLDRVAAQQATTSVQAPRFEVDPLWPKPLPNHWILGSTIGVAADADDHIWIIHRSSATLGNNEKTLETKQGECCAGAPPVLEFDQAGNLLRHWGGPGGWSIG